MHRTIERVLDRPETTAIVACDPDDPGFLFGHIVGVLPEVVHYVYVKAPYRRTGIARGLFAALGVKAEGYFSYTCKTGIVRDLNSKIPRARFDVTQIRYSRSNSK
jgi:GNAT superfamily N-acetyltransferase